MVILATILWLQAPSVATNLTIEEIMARVAENQDRTLEARSKWVFGQDMLVRLHRSNGKLAREESRHYIVTPNASGFDRDMDHFEGKYEAKGKFFNYTEPNFHYKGLDLDADLTSSFADEFLTSHRHKDGVNDEMFPLTKAEQAKYIYKLEGREDYRGTPVYKVSFLPRPKTEDAMWKGEALIHSEEFEPVLVSTQLGWAMPGAVKVLLGTDIHHVGFKITYKKVDSGVWFPETYGGEFFLKAAFLYKRNISVSVKNDKFQKTDVDSKVIFEKEPRL